MSKMILQIFVFMFILSCSQQTAPPLNLENEQKINQESDSERANLPEPPAATFATKEQSEIQTNDEQQDSGPTPEPIETPTEMDPKDELKLAPILYEDFAWEKYMVEPGDFLVKIAKKEYGDFKLWKYIYEWNIIL